MQRFLQYKNVWMYLLIGFSMISLLGDAINNRLDLVDFEVYFRTAGRMWEGAELYRIDTDGHFVYKYAPSAALFFMPFLLFGFSISKYIFWGLLTGAIILVLRLLQRKVAPAAATNTTNAVLFFAILSQVPHIHLEWHLGQVNMLLLLVYVCLFATPVSEKPFWQGGLLGTSLYVKPLGLIFVPYWILKKDWKALAYLLLTLVLFGALPYLFYPYWDTFIRLYYSWVNELQIEMSNKQDLLASGNHTIFSVLARYSPLSAILAFNPERQKIYQLIVLAFIGLSFLWYTQLGKKLKDAIIGEYVVLIAWIPLLAFTSQNAFIFCLPLMVYLFFDFRQMQPYQKVMLFNACLCIGINMYELVGKKLHAALMMFSIYTYGAIVLILLAYIRRYQKASQA